MWHKQAKVQFNIVRCPANTKQFIMKQKYSIRTKINECRTAVQDQSFNSEESIYSKQRKKLSKNRQVCLLEDMVYSLYRTCDQWGSFKKNGTKKHCFLLE